ncbi:protein DMR6-LIKE OXYGENASE 1-like [Cornus florida]|uniref:protein DMR6-LIKE OXYGENASE 1-like n=1 Tax=Cornus florida TaxID=4283 RepID=UPI0028971471|nr:protein DMR6-LIKE OXYGENASE 1-like [Cornus florida]
MTCQLPATTETLSGELPTSGDYQKGVKYITDMWPNLPNLPSEYVLPLTTNPLLVSHASIPVVDLSGLNGSAESRMRTIQAIDSACAEWGIFGMQLKIASALSEALGLDGDYIEKSLGGGFQVVGSNYYAPCPEPHRTLEIPDHSDHGGLTVLMQNDVDGLQVEHDGEWVSVGIVPGSFVVNIGDYMEILSNGWYKTLKHRGVTNKQRTRISIAVGNGPALTSTVAPASPLVDEKNEIKCHNHITYKGYMELHQNGTTRGKTPMQVMIDLQADK